jgi:hypothetical protein
LRAGWSLQSSLTFGSYGSGRAGFSALTLRALHSYLTTVARGAGHPGCSGHSRLSGRADLPTHTLGAGRSLQSGLTFGPCGSGRTLRAG